MSTTTLPFPFAAAPWQEHPVALAYLPLMPLEWAARRPARAASARPVSTSAAVMLRVEFLGMVSSSPPVRDARLQRTCPELDAEIEGLRRSYGGERANLSDGKVRMSGRKAGGARLAGGGVGWRASRSRIRARPTWRGRSPR